MLKEVEIYIKRFPSEIQKILKRIRKIIERVYSKNLEKMTYGVPGFKKDKSFVAYAAFKNHVGLYPRPKTIEHFSKELKKFKTSKGGIQFQLAEPIPYDLIKKIVEFEFKS